MRLDKVKWDVVEDLCQQYGTNVAEAAYGAPIVCDLEHTVVATDDVIVQPKWEVPKKIVVATAITGAFFMKSQNPYQPVTVEEIYQAGKEVCDAGCQIVHIHVRNDAGYSCIDVDKFQATIGRLQKEYPDRMFECCIVPKCPGDWDKMEELMDLGITETVVVNTTAAFCGDYASMRGPHILLKKARLVQEHGCAVKMAVYNDGDIDNADRYLVKTGVVEGPTQWGILPALPGSSPMNNPIQMVEGLLHLYYRIKDVDPDAIISVCAAGRPSSYLANLAALMGFNVRIGMEDTYYRWPHSDVRLQNNAQFFREFKSVLDYLGLGLATPNEYRAKVGLPLK